MAKSQHQQPSADSEGTELREIAAEQIHRNEDLQMHPVSSSSTVKSTVETAVYRHPWMEQPTTRLHRSGFALILALGYTGLALTAWVILCVLCVRPISGTKRLPRWTRPQPLGTNIEALRVRTETLHRTARVLQAILSLITIPVTSAICASAAVIFVQRKSRSFSLRQLMTLADRSWSNPLASGLAVLNWSRYGSFFLMLAISVNLLGTLFSPVLEIFLSFRTIQVRSEAKSITGLFDLSSQRPRGYAEDTNFVVVHTRNALMTATPEDPQAHLWQGGLIGCSPAHKENTHNHTNTGNPSSSCGRGVNFSNMSALADPFLAELPNGYNTGLIQQFIPRINSTAKYENISMSEYPSNCRAINGSFSAEYSGQVLFRNVTDVQATWKISACMPVDMRKSPWHDTMDRQDFSEVLYLNISIAAGDQIQEYYNLSTPPDGSLFRLTVQTTAGYFELPNDMNGGIPGPLLANDPNSICGENCLQEGLFTNHTISNEHSRSSLEKREDGAIHPFKSSISNYTLSLERVPNKGPLLAVALALFGDGSHLSNVVTFPEAYTGINFTGSRDEFRSDPPNAESCNNLAPLSRLLPEGSYYSSKYSYCLTNTNGGGWNRGYLDTGLSMTMLTWVHDLTEKTDRVQNAFAAATFLANKAWMMYNDVAVIGRSLSISYDYGVDIDIPSISTAGIITVSVLLGVYLALLIGLALYSWSTPRWTATFDSFAMMKIGAAMPDNFPLKVGMKTAKMGFLDDLPGIIADTRSNSDVGQLALVASPPVGLGASGRRFQSYEETKEPFTGDENLIIVRDGRAHGQEIVWPED